MSVFWQEQSENIEWIIWELNESIPQLQGLLDCPDNSINTIKTDKRKMEFLTSRILLKKLFGECIVVKYNRHGSPYIENSDWNISITHSGKYVAVARSKYPLGIDVEQITEKLERIKHKFSSTEELKNIYYKENLMHLALYWSAKESVYKLVGNEALIFDENMIIEEFIPQKEGAFKLHLQSSRYKQLVEIKYQTFEDYVFCYSILA